MLRGALAGLLFVFCLAGTSAQAAPVLDFEGLALFADPSLESLAPFSFSPSALVDEVTLGTLVGFQVPGDVAPGTLATSGSQGLVNLFDPILLITLQQPVGGLELSVVTLQGQPLLLEALDSVGQVIDQWQGLPPLGPSGFPQGRFRLEQTGISALRVSAGLEATSFFLDDLEVVPEPRLALLLAAASLFAAFRASERRTSRRGVTVAGGLLFLACAGSPVSILSPTEGEVIFGPDVSVHVAFSPPIQASETIEATLVLGIDDADQPPMLIDVSADLQLAADGASADLPLVGLAPGRNTVSIKRFPGAGGPASGFDTVTIDRGGFFSDTTGPFNAGVHLDQAMFIGAFGNPRVLDLTVWYPTESVAAPTPILGGIQGAPVAPGAAALPVLFFSHGSCGIPAQSTFLTAGLAQAGWLVVAMTHPPNVFGPTCATAVNLTTSFVERPADVSGSLDWLVAENADPTSIFFGLADLDRVGVAGHSFGGMTAFRVPAVDPRFRAALPLAPEYDSVAPFVAALLPLSVPIMIQGGEFDTTTPFLLDQVPLYNQMVATRFLVEILGGGHGSFTDFCSAPAVCDFGLINHYAFGFLGRYVASDRRWASLISAQPGAVLTADP